MYQAAATLQRVMRFHQDWNLIAQLRLSPSPPLQRVMRFHQDWNSQLDEA